LGQKSCPGSFKLGSTSLHKEFLQRLADSLASEFSVPRFRNTLSVPSS